MGIFSNIMDKLRHHGAAAPQQQASADPVSAQQQGGFKEAAKQAPQQTQEQRTLQNVDVDAVLQQMAAKKGGGGNYRTSIVDLLKLLDLDSSLDARKELATELGVQAGAPGSAEQNIALQKAVMRKLAENGGRVPEDLRH
jgi:hypothetical protein